jgi:pimeloyl-ACP methyl ester carboxylesterase
MHRPAGTSLLALLLFVAGLPTASAATQPAGVSTKSIPVTFHVVNTNTSKVPCLSDGLSYDVVGRLTGPSSVLEKGPMTAATLYLHGDGVDESLWNYRRVPGYDYATEMARQGQISVTITRLGYKGSGKPDGNKICLGSEADVAHQIVGQLRSGRYQLHPPDDHDGTAPGLPIQRIALAGHSAAGFVAMAEAYSYQDLDGLLVVASGEFVSPRVPEAVSEQQARCTSSTDGYALIEGTDDEAATDFFHDADPVVIADTVAHRPRDSCGGLLNSPLDFVADAALLRTIRVPVLVVAGEQDAFFPDPESQGKLFSGSPDVVVSRLPDTGHAITLGHSAPTFRALMAEWLYDHMVDKPIIADTE